MRVQDHFLCYGKYPHLFPLKNDNNNFQIVILVFYDYHKIPVLQEEEELLPNMKEVSHTQGTMGGLELLKEQSKTDNSALASVEMERLRLTEKLQESQEEIKSLTEERDNLKMTIETLQVEHDQLKEDLRETLANVSFILSSHLIIFHKNQVFGRKRHLIIKLLTVFFKHLFNYEVNKNN